MKPTNEDFLKCQNRMMGHQWDELGVPVRKRRAGYWGNLIDFRCDRCGTIKHVLLNTWGAIEARWYEYPDGYQYAKGERPSNEDLRLQLLKQMRKISITTKVTSKVKK